MVRIQNAQGEDVLSIEDWPRPKEPERQWKDGRSAKELARAWFRPSIPKELVELLASCPETQGIQIDLAIPEKVTRLDNLRGEHRNHDLVLHAHMGRQRVVIGVEAKADEPFGSKTVSQCLKKAQGTRSRIPERVVRLCHALFGCEPEKVGDLRYQLLTAVAGTLIEAGERHADMAIFLVHEFVTLKTTKDRHDANAADLDHFVTALGARGVKPGGLVGPFSVPGAGRVPSGIPLFIAKARVDLRRPGRRR
ncbi:MAG: hypothetical protein MUP47_03360 [Phycisphaerae bacterium]|nr:hypothetical protein [Phycisphaerae bacterium]